MYPLFATRFAVAPGSDPYSSTAELVRREVLDAVGAPGDGHRVGHALERGEGGSSLWRLVSSRPAAADASFLCVTRCTVAAVGEECEVSVQVGAVSREYRVAPIHWVERAPQFVGRLLEAFECRIETHRLRAVPLPVAAEQVDGFLDRVLFAEGRLLPVVVYAPTAQGELRSDPVEDADALAGVARVHRLADEWAVERFEEEMGTELGCRPGDVRLYWPDLHDESPAEDHPRWALPKARLPGLEPKPVATELLRLIGPLTVLRFQEGRITQEARGAVEFEREKQGSILRRRLLEGSLTLEQLRTELGLAWSEVEELRGALKETADERDAALQQAMELEDQCRELGLQFARWGRGTRTAGGEDAAVESGRDLDALASVREALDAAERDFGGVLDVWASARDSADRSDYAHPGRVWLGLRAVAEVARCWFESVAASRPMGRFEDAFRERGFTRYRATESETTRSLYGEQRRFREQGVEREILQHLTIGGGDRKNCLQIYFDLEPATGKAIVAWCGPHLDIASSRARGAG
jgi:hypothetical protein